MHKLTIVFERVVNKGFAKEKDKLSTKGVMVVGTPGEHTELWHCAVCDRLGWPIAGLTAEYFMRKISAGATPVEILNEGPFPQSWSDDQKDQISAVLAMIKPQVEMNKRLKELEGVTSQRSAETSSSRKVKGPGEQALPS